MVAAKPDCTGQVFGWLKVIERAEIIRVKGKSRRLWLLECLLCGALLKLPRGDFDRKSGGQRSCGCARSRGLVDNKRSAKDITGQKFGQLTAVHLTGKKDKSGKPTWLMQCDCGGTREMSLSRLGIGYALHCDRPIHQREKGLHYPPTPDPIPGNVWRLVEKYLYLTRPGFYTPKFDAREQDERFDRLIRTAWIIVYRRSIGEEISDLHEHRLISKTLRYSRHSIQERRRVEAGLPSRYTFRRYNRQGIGSAMTKFNIAQEVVSTEGKTQPDSTLFIRSRKIKFKRC